MCARYWKIGKKVLLDYADFMQLLEENRNLRLKKKQSGPDRLMGEGHTNTFQKGTLFGLQDHLDQLLALDDMASEIASGLKQTIANHVVEYFERCNQKTGKLDILEFDGLQGNYRWLPSPVTQRDISLKLGKLNRVFVLSMDAMGKSNDLEGLVKVPTGNSGSTLGFPRRPFSFYHDNVGIEELIWGPNVFDFLDYLNRRIALSESNETNSVFLRQMHASVIDKLLSDLAYFQAHPPEVPTSSQILPRTGEKLAKAATILYKTDNKLNRILNKIGNYLDQYAYVPYRDAWLFNSMISLMGVLGDLKLDDLRENYAWGKYGNERITDSQVLESVFKRPDKLKSYDAIETAIISNVYQRDFGRINYSATWDRDVWQILLSAVSLFDEDQVSQKIQQYQQFLEMWGGQRREFEHDMNLSQLNYHFRSAYTFLVVEILNQYKQPIHYHLGQIYRVVQRLETPHSLLSVQEIDYLKNATAALSRDYQ